MFTANVTTRSDAGYEGEVYSWVCPLCTYAVDPNLLQEWVCNEVWKHMWDIHNVRRHYVYIEIKELARDESSDELRVEVVNNIKDQFCGQTQPHVAHPWLRYNPEPPYMRAHQQCAGTECHHA